MSEIRFIGKSDRNFTNGRTYQLINMFFNENGDIGVFISNNDKKIKYIPYTRLYLFNENWEVVND